MAETIDIVCYSEEHRDAQRDFAQKCWPKKKRRREERYLRWKFRGAPNGPVEGLLLAVSGSRVVGQLGLIPGVLQERTAVNACQWACDLMVDPELRRAGIGSRLFAAAVARDVVTLGSNPSPAARATMLRLGFSESSGPWTMLLPLDPAHVISLRMPQPSYGLTQGLAWLSRPFFNLRARMLLMDQTRLERCDWMAVVTAIAEHGLCGADAGIVHDREFLAWRCAGLDGFSTELSAFRTTAGGYAVVGSAPPYLYVYDWAASSVQEAAALLGAARRFAKSEGCLTVLALAQVPEERAWLARLGFFPMRRRWSILRFPPREAQAEITFRYCPYDSDGNL
jgi:GNAT superfamily N-acetyltransferase